MINQAEILELIKIANLFPYNADVPEYAREIESKYLETTGQLLTHTAGKPGVFVVTEQIWNGVLEQFPEAAEYAENGSKAIFGEKIFEKIPDSRSNIASAYKLQNFIRLQRIRNNMRIAAFVTRQRAKNEPCYLPPGETLSAWQSDNYSIFGNSPLAPYRVNKDGNAVFHSGLVQYFLERIDTDRIKTCAVCFNIFWAKPKNSKYCSEKCVNRKKAKRHYEKNKTIILKERKAKYQNGKNGNL
jgi:predicted nucleic acid-binding Zn ribbon protein